MTSLKRMVAPETMGRPRPARPPLVVPFEALEPVGSETREAIEAVALRANDRYLIEFIEHFSFCPFSREGRKAGATERHVYYADSVDPVPLFELMKDIVNRPEVLVSQVIMPIIEVSAPDWRTFCHELTAAAHEHIGGAATMAVADLHPGLSYTTANPFSLLTLFRRAPDPTIQWVRLDALDAIYAGRGKGDTVVLSPHEIMELLRAPPKRTLNLYDRIAETNMAMARRLGFPAVEDILAGYALEARRNYQRILLEASL